MLNMPFTVKPAFSFWTYESCVLQVHAANKPIDRSNDDAVLQKVAELAVGYSGAELANLLNEAAILAVRPSPHCTVVCVSVHGNISANEVRIITPHS